MNSPRISALIIWPIFLSRVSLARVSAAQASASAAGAVKAAGAGAWLRQPGPASHPAKPAATRIKAGNRLRIGMLCLLIVALRSERPGPGRYREEGPGPAWG